MKKRELVILSKDNNIWEIIFKSNHIINCIKINKKIKNYIDKTIEYNFR